MITMSSNCIFVVVHETFENTNCFFFSLHAAKDYINRVCEEGETNSWFVFRLTEGQPFEADFSGQGAFYLQNLRL